MVKTCGTCHIEQPISEFYLDTRSPTHRPRSMCKSCLRGHGRRWFRCNKDKQVIYNRRSLLVRFGMTEERYNAMLEAQGGGCAICGGTNSDGRRLAMDHDHRCCPRKNGCCGECIRGLLCHHCNLLLGQALDRPDLLRKAADYLELF